MDNINKKRTKKYVTVNKHQRKKINTNIDNINAKDYIHKSFNFDSIKGFIIHLFGYPWWSTGVKTKVYQLRCGLSRYKYYDDIPFIEKVKINRNKKHIVIYNDCNHLSGRIVVKDLNNRIQRTYKIKRKY